MQSGKSIENLVETLRGAHPELGAVRRAATEPVYVVGGAVRDLLLGRDRADLDLVVEGDAVALAAKLGAESLEHERFATAKVRLDGHEVDIASARSETYSHPGALPDVVAGAGIEADLGRRDFTINAMAIPLEGSRLIDPYGGRADLEAGQLRVLHAGSFVDDPTRAIRAARYAARFGFELEAATEGQLRATDLETVSADRRGAELLRLADEPGAIEGFRLLAEWGLVGLRDGGLELMATVEGALGQHDWPQTASRGKALLAAALGPPGAEVELAAIQSPRPAEGVALASGRDPVELVLASAMGAVWIGRYMAVWSKIELEIDGSDLIAAGVAEGPAVGRGLDAALRKRLEGEIDGREEELATALEAARAE
jgi:tRNA nucleotidyltransferase (CCA-adding enzyme)